MSAIRHDFYAAESASSAHRRQHLARAVETFVRSASYKHVTDHRAYYHDIVSRMHALASAVQKAEDAGIPKHEIMEIVAPARVIHARSPFVQRLQTWPRKYPGDFETIEYLCNGIPHARAGSPEYYIEYHCLHNISAQQHRNKVAWQAERIVDAARRKPQAKILSLACGGCRDLRLVKDALLPLSPQIVINDIDPDAIALSLSELRELKDLIHPIAGDVFRSMRDFRKESNFDLIVVGGLFDYLNDRTASWLLQNSLRLLNADGSLCFTNIRKGNPDRAWLQYIASWDLIERDDDDIRRLLEDAGSRARAHIIRDTTALANLVEVARSK